MKARKFQKGDRVVADILDSQIKTATVEKYDERSDLIVWCIWDDDGDLAHIGERHLEFDPITLTPLFQALK